MKIIFEYIVDTNTEQHLSDVLIEKLKDYIPSKKGVIKAIKRETIKVNGKTSTTGYKLKKGDVIQLFEPPETVKKIFPLKIKVVYEDEFIAIVWKPSGIPTSGNYYKTLLNCLPFNLSLSAQNNTIKTLSPVHRLDNQTSGLVIIAKTKAAQIQLGEQFKNKLVQKTYHALVLGQTAAKGEIHTTINGLKSLSLFEKKSSITTKSHGVISLLKLNPKTGRTHQLRIHCKQLGTPILGDKLYGIDKKRFKGKGLFLSATGLKFEHPITKTLLHFEEEIPLKFNRYLEWQKRLLL